MLELLRDELDKHNTFTSSAPKVLEMLAETIPKETVPYKMKLSIAVSELFLFTSQFRRNIMIWNDSQIPVNAITISLGSSGVGKDSSVSSVRKCFSLGYSAIDKRRDELAHTRAKTAAARDGVENPNKWEEYKPYYKKPNDIFVSPGTVEGFIGHLNEIEAEGLASGYLFTGEFGSALTTSSTMDHNIEFLAEVYDEGSKEAKIIKSKENQNKSIKNLPVSALFIGSHHNILFDIATKNKFEMHLKTKLARRAFFNFNPNKELSREFSSITEMLLYEKSLEQRAKQRRLELIDIFEDVAMYHLDKAGEPLEVSEAVQNLYIIYTRYNEEVAETMSKQYEISRLVRRHLQWKALKLAGALAMIEKCDKIEVYHYTEAISFVEKLDIDMGEFEKELVKDAYELLVSFFHEIQENNKAFLDVHLLRKMNFITSSSNISSKLKDLVVLATNYDKSAIYRQTEDGISFEKIVKTNSNGISYLAVKGSKEDRAKSCSKGFQFVEVSFAALADLLSQDFAYSPFQFKDGVRSTENLTGGCKWIALDIDKSEITDLECHRLLAEYNHHISRTSDPNNEFKFRLLLELDSIVDIDAIYWKDFTQSIAEFIGLKIDNLPKAQIYFSYKDREVLSVIDKSTIEVRDHILLATSKQEAKSTNLTVTQKKAMLADPYNTFTYAYEAISGKGSIALFRAAKHAKDLGMTKDEVITLVREINDYWVVPMDETRLQNTIISQINRWS